MIKPHRGRHRNRRNDPHEVTMVTREEEEEEEEEQGLDSQKQQQRYYPASRRRLHNSQLMVVITVILALFQIQMGMSRVLMSLNRKCISCPCSPLNLPTPIVLLLLFVRQSVSHPTMCFSEGMRESGT